MAKWIVAVFIVLILSLTGLLLLAALLWWLIKQQRQGTAAPALAIEEAMPEVPEASMEAMEAVEQVEGAGVAQEAEVPAPEAEWPAAPFEAEASGPQARLAGAEFEAEAVIPDVRPAPVEFETPRSAEVPAPSRRDDLTRIEGIGPKISAVLQAAGVATFAQLAATQVDRLGQILEEADPRLRRIANPASWPEQASLAAAGAWDALEALQRELKGGRPSA